MLIDKKKTLALASVFLCLSVFVFLAAPGLYGDFVLDDWPNLASLVYIESQGFWSVVFEGVSSTLGRPVSLFSFAIQSQHWPSNPFAFKLINFIMHNANACLVFFLSRELYRLCFPQSHLQFYFAGCVCLYWLYLPIHASTIFYVVQRMTMLSTMFVLIGFWGWLRGIRFANEGRPKLGVGFATVFVSFGYAVGVLSKESAILLGVFIICSVILFKYRGVVLPFVWKVWLIVFAVMPLVALVFYLSIGERYLSGYSIRHFTPYERVLTELRILWEYVFKIYIPLNSSLNLFNDGFQVSRGLLSPVSTLVSLLSWVAVLGLAILKYKQWPFFAFGLCWFLGGHLLESTILGLELYFEHRNYLPSLGLVILVVGSAFQWVERCFKENSSLTMKQLLSKRKVILLVSVFALWLCWLGFVLKGESESWSSSREMAISSLRERPESLRATQEAAAYFANVGDYQQSAMILHHIDKKWPGYPGTRTQQIMLNCYDPNVMLPSHEEMVLLFKEGRMDRGAVPALKEVLSIKKSGGCSDLSWEHYRSYLFALVKNNNFRGQRENITILLAYSYNADEKFQAAAEVLDTYTTTRSSLGYRVLKAQFWAMAGDIEKAKKIVSSIREQYKENPRIWLLHSGKIDSLERMLEHGDTNTETYL